MANWQLGLVFARYEGSGVGINKITAAEDSGNYVFNEGLLMMSLGGILFFILGLYLDQVLPKEYGGRKGCCFMFQPSSYGCCKNKRRGLDPEEADRREKLLNN